MLQRPSLLNKDEAILLCPSINKYLQPHINTDKESRGTKSHPLKIISKSNFILSIAGVCTLRQAILTEEFFFCTDQEKRKAFE